jgi:hypothetical protein
MKDYRSKPAFEKAFKTFVTNFDETKIWFTYTREIVDICFVENGKLKKFRMWWKSEHYIQLDGWRFIEFLETGKFPTQSYVMVYDDESINPEDIGKVFEFDGDTDDEYKQSNGIKKATKFLAEYRKNYPNCGMKFLPKPMTTQPTLEFLQHKIKK